VYEEVEDPDPVEEELLDREDVRDDEEELVDVK
jgi:hypothetical protein